MEIAPALAEKLLQVFCALLVDGAEALFYVCALLQAIAEAQEALFQRSVDKDVIDVGLVLENALGAPAHDNAIALDPGLLDDFLGEFYRLFGIEYGVIVEREAGSKGGGAHGLLVEAAEP